MAATVRPISARDRQLNRAEVVDRNFIDFVAAHPGPTLPRPAPGEPVVAGSALDAGGFLELFESQLISRHLDLMARVLRVQNKVYYTIGSSGHEGNAMVARLARHTDPAFLHYRSGGFMAERFRKLPGLDPVMDSALSFAASREDPASGGRHKVWGSKPLWVLPQTSTIASHLPKAYGTALAIEQARRIGHRLPVPDDSLVICSFGDASANHATAQTAFNAAEWGLHQGITAPVLFVCEDNGVAAFTRAESVTAGAGVSARAEAIGVPAASVDGNDALAVLDLAETLVSAIRRGEGPRLLHARTFRLLGHTSTDPAAWRDAAEVEAARGREPISRLEAWLAGNGAERDLLAAIAAEAEAKMAAARRAALAAPWPEAAAAFTHVQDIGAVAAPA